MIPDRDKKLATLRQWALDGNFSAPEATLWLLDEIERLEKLAEKTNEARAHSSRLLWMIVSQCGGKARIPERLKVSVLDDEWELYEWKDPQTGDTMLVAKNKTCPPGPDGLT